MTKDINKSLPKLDTTPEASRKDWNIWFAVAAIVGLAALAGAYWSRLETPPLPETSPVVKDATEPAPTVTPPAAPR